MNVLIWIYNFLTATQSIGTSMLPTLPKYCLVKTKKTHSYKIGDIINLKTLDNKYHIHRITEITARFVSTKGDNLQQQSYEINVPTKNIQGKLIWNYPKGK